MSICLSVCLSLYAYVFYVHVSVCLSLYTCIFHSTVYLMFSVIFLSSPLALSGLQVASTSCSLGLGLPWPIIVALPQRRQSDFRSAGVRQSGPRNFRFEPKKILIFQAKICDDLFLVLNSFSCFLIKRRSLANISYKKTF